MLRETLSSTDLLSLPLFAFLLFLTTFVIVVLRVLLKKRDDTAMRALAALPLADDVATPSHPHDPEATR